MDLADGVGELLGAGRAPCHRFAMTNVTFAERIAAMSSAEIAGHVHVHPSRSKGNAREENTMDEQFTATLQKSPNKGG